MAHLASQCERGEADACEALSREEEAKMRWLSSLDVPVWGKVSAVMSEAALLTARCASGDDVASCRVVANESAAKAAWLRCARAPRITSRTQCFTLLLPAPRA